MLGVKTFEPKLYYQLSLNQLVPVEDFYRQVDRVLDLSFVYPLCQPLYGSTGRPSIDPALFFKIELIGYLENLIADRALMRRIQDSLSLRLFIHHDLDEPLPWHSTISRTRALIPSEVYQAVFDRVLTLCVQAGLVEGKVQGIDSALIKANASLDSLERRHPQWEVLDHRQKALDANAEPLPAKIGSTSSPALSEERSNPKGSWPNTPTPPVSKIDDSRRENTAEPLTGSNPQPSGSNVPLEVIAAAEKPPHTLSNKDYVSPSDPEAKISKKPGTLTDLHYTEQVAVDSRCNIVTEARAVSSDSPDQQSLLPVVDSAATRLAQHGLILETVVTDGNYFSIENLQAMEDRRIEAYLLNPPVSPEQRHAPVLVRLLERLRTGTAATMKKIRQTTTETIISEHKNQLGLRQILCRGLDKAHKKILLVSCASNLKKLLRHAREHPPAMALSQEAALFEPFQGKAAGRSLLRAVHRFLKTPGFAWAF